MISVIIPTYNCDKYIRETINSVLCQTYKDFEVIVVDDGSTDGTRDIIERSFPNVRYHYTLNQGVSRARNYGIRKAQGEFVAFLDADDFWLPEKLEKQIKVLEADPDLMMVFTDILYFNENGTDTNQYSNRERLMKGDVVTNIFLKSGVGTSSVMVRKSVFEKIGVFEEGLRAAEDDNLWLRIALNFKINLIDEVLVHYRITEVSLSRTTSIIISGVRGHLELLESKYPELRNHLGRANIRRKKSVLYFTQGYFLFSNNQFGWARYYFLRSFFFFPRRNSLFYFWCSFLPEAAIERTRKIKRKLRLLQKAF